MTVPSADFTVSMPIPFRLYQARLPGSAQFPDARGTGVDVVHLEVGARAALAGLHVGDRQPPLVADACHVVLEGAGVGLELPPEQPAPKLAALPGVVGGDLEVHDLTRHGS